MLSGLRFSSFALPLHNNFSVFFLLLCSPLDFVQQSHIDAEANEEKHSTAKLLCASFFHKHQSTRRNHIFQLLTITSQCDFKDFCDFFSSLFASAACLSRKTCSKTMNRTERRRKIEFIFFNLKLFSLLLLCAIQMSFNFTTLRFGIRGLLANKTKKYKTKRSEQRSTVDM